MASTGNSNTPKLVGISDAWNNTLQNVIKAYDREDRDERQEHRPLWMKLENYWEGFQRLYWSLVAKDWKVLDGDDINIPRNYDKIINVYRAYGESVIAALSVKTPSAIFYPADAEIEEDLVTAKACVKIKEQIERHNQAQLLLVKGLMILWNTGTVASYIYNKKSTEYGTYAEPQFADQPDKLHTTLLNCPECGSNINEVQSDSPNKIPEESTKCAICGYEGVPDQEHYEEDIPKIIGTKLYPKSRTIIEVFSPLFVYIPFYARKQEHIPYLRLRFEQHYSLLKNLYPKLKKQGFTPAVDREFSDERNISIGVNDNNLATVDCWWIRPWGLDVIDILDENDKSIEGMKEKYPKGIYIVVIGGQIVEIAHESLDEHWEISNNPLSTYIHGEPLGKPVAPVQDLQNEVTDLQIETFEHAIPETFARGDVLDFKKYANSEAAPGMIYPAIPPADGTPLNQAFFSVQTATLSEENDLFQKRLDDKGQFLSSAYPSIYGGPAQSGSKTAREYTESQAAALQRLSLVWSLEKHWWAGTMGKAVPLFITDLKQTGEDYKSVERNTTGFINNWIRQADLQGEIGRVEADAEEDLPTTPGQLKNVIIQLMSLKDQFINEALYHPQNAPMLAKALGAPDFYIPNSDDRNKQYAEFADLLNGIAVEVNIELDNHSVEAETCRTFLISPSGLAIKKNNPQGYQAILEHFIAHTQAIQQKQMGGASPNQPTPNTQVQPNQPPASPEAVNSDNQGDPNVQ